jgi:hypothetical protein
MIHDFGILSGKGHNQPQLAKILKPAFGNYALVPIFAVLFEERG